jgi:glyoxylase-like metal-dependent hydrolase (beta-lactamase superfamily II)/rhodanese-related sulfurtransferase
MEVQQLYTKCLAEATYYIQSKNEAVIIDPLRETEPYLEKLKEDKAILKYIFLTHFHADFVSGHVDLARITGATIVYGPTAKAAFDFYEGKDNEDFQIGEVRLRLLHTPGHTLESSSFLLFDESGKEHCLFSGDTLFIGDVGRPDLAVTSTISKEDLAAKLYSSLHDKILKLPDDVIIYPNHGKGSACGKKMSSETFDTLGHQKKVNYALDLNLNKEDFVNQVLDGLTSPPQYFPKNAKMNTQINKDINQVISDGLFPMTISQMMNHTALKYALLLDVRTVEEFAKEHIPNSIFIGLDGTFAPWVGALIKDMNQPIILIAPKGREKEAITRLSRIGYDNVLGYLEDGVYNWKEKGYKTESILCITANSEELLNSDTLFIDVRRDGEYNEDHTVNATHISLQEIYNTSINIDKEQRYYVYCAGGYRSVIAISILKQLGFLNLVNIDGGFTQILKSKIPLKNCRKNCDSCACNH